MPRLKIKSENRPYTIYPNDFIDCEEILTANEKLICFILFRYGEKIFPSLKTLSKKSGLSKKTVQRVIDSLENKKILLKEHRQNKEGGNQSNLYYLHDSIDIWQSKTIEELEIATKETELEKAIKILKNAGYIVTKERELASRADQSIDTSTQQNKYFLQQQNTTPVPKSQELQQEQKKERYTLDQIRQLFDYDIMIQDNQHQQKDIDSVIDILHTTMNTTKEILRVNGENKPSMVVIGKLMKLNKESIIYAINKFAEQTDRIKNSTAYMLTILYNAPEQFNLDIQNQMQYNMNTPIKDYNELERQLLG